MQYCYYEDEAKHSVPSTTVCRCMYENNGGWMKGQLIEVWWKAMATGDVINWRVWDVNDRKFIFCCCGSR
jgi:hypothetical protein